MTEETKEAPMITIKDKTYNIEELSDKTKELLSLHEQAMQMAQAAAQAPKEEDSNTKAAAILAEVEREKAQMKMQSDMAKLELEKQKAELKSQKEMLELQQDRVQFEKEMALKELEFAQKAQSEQDKVVMESLEKIQNMATPK